MAIQKQRPVLGVYKGKPQILYAGNIVELDYEGEKYEGRVVATTDDSKCLVRVELLVDPNKLKRIKQ